MKRIIVLALAALVAGASFNTALADKKKKKKAKEEQQQEVVEVKQPVQYSMCLSMTWMMRTSCFFSVARKTRRISSSLAQVSSRQVGRPMLWQNA